MGTKKHQYLRPPGGGPHLVLFGADEYCKPRAARFSGTDAAVLAKVANAMCLCMVEVKESDLADIAKKLPAGNELGIKTTLTIEPKDE
jgi:hypothetical protein